MIRFACPRCKTVLDRPEHEAGSKLACPSCQQRLQVPRPPLNKTVIGSLVEPGIGSALAPATLESTPPAAGATRFRIVDGREYAYWHCPSCQNEVNVAMDLGQATVRCPHCARRIAAPRAAPGTMTQPLEGEAIEKPSALPMMKWPATPASATPPPVPIESSPTATRPGLSPTSDDWGQPQRRRNSRDDDDFDDDRGRPARRRYAPEECTHGANVGFICGLLSVGMIFAALVIWMVVMAGRPRGHEVDPFVFLILAISLGAFILGLIGTIFSTRGLDEQNTRNRGLALGGLICGILGMALGLIGSTFFFFCGMLLLALPWR